MNILEVLTSMRQGKMIHELDVELTDLVRKVIDTNKPGAVTITLKVAPNTEDGAQVAIVDAVAVKIPAPPRKKTIFFTKEDGSLHRRDPRQQDLSLTEVNKLGGVNG